MNLQDLQKAYAASLAQGETAGWGSNSDQLRTRSADYGERFNREQADMLNGSPSHMDYSNYGLSPQAPTVSHGQMEQDMQPGLNRVPGLRELLQRLLQSGQFNRGMDLSQP